MDARLPVGVDRAEIRAAVERILARYPEVTFREGDVTLDATWSDPEHEMVGHIQDNVQPQRATFRKRTASGGSVRTREYG